MEQQALKVMPYPVNSPYYSVVRLKLQSEYGSTNWMNVTPEQFKAIEEILSKSN